MHRVFFGFIISMTASFSHAAGLPYAAAATVPDYTAYMVVHETYGRGPDTIRTVYHHADRVLVEERKDDETAVQYGIFSDNVVFSTTRKSGEITRVAISRVEPSKDYLGIKEVMETGNRETVAGEPCQWLVIVRNPPHEKSGPTWMSCLTDDGIEVANKVLFSSGQVMEEARLSRIIREPVAETTVSPPMALFDLDRWLEPMQAYSETPANATDFEATLASSDSKVKLLRHYPWWFRKRDGKDGSLRLSVWNELEDQGFSYRASRGERRLVIARAAKDRKGFLSEFDSGYGLEKLSKTDRFLGEDCTWYDLMPNVADAGRTQCLTSDGIPLQDNFSSGWGAGEYFETLEFKRRAVTLEEMRPSAEYVTPAAWGFQARDEQ